MNKIKKRREIQITENWFNKLKFIINEISREDDFDKRQSLIERLKGFVGSLDDLTK